MFGGVDAAVPAPEASGIDIYGWVVAEQLRLQQAEQRRELSAEHSLGCAG